MLFTRQRESGVVLISTLILIVLLGVMISGIFLTTANDLIGSTNYRCAGQAVVQTQAGLEYILSRIQRELNENSSGSVSAVDPADCEVPEGFRFDACRIGDWTGNGPYAMTITGFGPADSRFQIQARFTSETVSLPAFRYGMMAGRNIHLTDVGSVRGNLHANGVVRQMGSGVIEGNVSASEDVSVAVAAGRKAVAAVLSRRVPVVPDVFKASEWFPKEPENGMEGEWEQVNGSFLMTEIRDLGNRLWWFDGDVRVEGNVFQGAVFASGDIVVEGSVGRGGVRVDTVLMARGSIVCRSAEDNVGVFWCNRDFLQEGSGIVHGIVVAGEDIRMGTGSGFQVDTDVCVSFLPQHREVNLLEWKRMDGSQGDQAGPGK
jgi:cytoskeletal protein CcmA (bactofilin family)